jgi:hypothetical protein
MSRTPARVTQADVARAIRAAQQCDAGQVKICADGSIVIEPRPAKKREPREIEVAPTPGVVL